MQVVSPNAAPDPRALVAVAELYSPRYARHGDHAIVVDVSGLTRLVGPPPVIAEEIARSAREHGLTIQLAVACTRMTAIVLAHARPGITVVPAGEETSALSRIRLTEVVASACGHAEPRISESEARHQRKYAPGVGPRRQEMMMGGAPRAGENDDRLATFARWGLRSLGELAALPADQLSARIGRDGARWQALARGEDLEPFIPDRPEERFEGSHALEWPIDGLEPLSFVLTRLFEPLSARLAARDRGVAVLHVRLHLVTREMHARRLELPMPLRDVKTLRTLALLDLESHPPAEAVDRVDVSIEPTPGRVLQHTLFSRAQPAPDHMATLIARLGALMGQDRVGSPAVVDTYRPGAFAMRPFPFTIPNSQFSIPDRPLTAALRRCRRPVPARVVMDRDRPVRVTTDRPELPGGRVVSSTGPWRTSGFWWTSATGPASRDEERLPVKKDDRLASSKNWHRDEWDVVLSDGAAYRVFQDHDRQRWFIEALAD